MSTDSLSGVRAAAENLRAAEESAQQPRAELAKILSRQSSALAALRKITDDREQADTAAILGDKPVARDPTATKEAARREAEIAAIARALPVARRACDAAEQRIDRAALELNAAKAVWASAEQERARAILVNQLSALAPSLARLRALDEIQVGMIQAGTVFNKGAEPPRLWSGTIIVSRLLGGLLPRVRPPSLSDDELSGLTAAALVALNKDIETQS